jgi:hypothetical protein
MMVLAALINMSLFASAFPDSINISPDLTATVPSFLEAYAYMRNISTRFINLKKKKKKKKWRLPPTARPQT